MADKIVETSKTNQFDFHINKLPTEIVGRFLGKLSVVDRLESERVSPRWRWALEKWGWTEQKKLDRAIVFEGATDEQIARFWQSDGDTSNLVSLFYRISHNLVELDLHSFGQENLQAFIPTVAESIQSLPRLEKLNIEDFDLSDFVEHLPPTLRELKTSHDIRVVTLETLSLRCPNLVEVPFELIPNEEVDNLNLDRLVALIGKFPRQKRLNFRDSLFPKTTKPGALAVIGQLKCLEKLDLIGSSILDEESFEAILVGCQNLQHFFLNTENLDKQAIFQLAKMPKLTKLTIIGGLNGVFTDSVLKAIAQRDQLKELVVCQYNDNYDENFEEKEVSLITDESIVYLVDHCKSLVSLFFWRCPDITERSLEAVIAEVQRRHGSPPRAFPSGPLDSRMFYFHTVGCGIARAKEVELIGDNPWLRFGIDHR